MIVLDSGGLIGLEKDNARAVAIVRQALARKLEVVIPATVLAQCWRNSPRQHAVSRLLKADAVRVADLTQAQALAIGSLLAVSGTADVVDAHVVVLARSLHATLVVTSDPDDLTALDSHLRLHVV
ncbi:PIN domain-containing protein [Nocardia sp. CDC153]|uniref:PIN domain-containing protein n=1 Tax=Nocardia sp. CDC153 TaxID=3112167 RepID=UPI002DB834AC|nr:PIN domain-containing protein [Nocardia sp. CDC153]MEC3952490.1 PIN domain-containing protein [Nocardia sp. CDC153]